MNLFYFFGHLIDAATPRILLQAKKNRLAKKYAHMADYVDSRVNYYCKLKDDFSLSPIETSIGSFSVWGKSFYRLDLKEYLRYFPKRCRFRYYFGDETHIEPVPTIFKARPIDGDNANSVLFKLVKHRHFRFVDDQTPFADKKDMAVFRGACHQPHRIRFMETLFNHPMVDAGQTNPSQKHPEWRKRFTSVRKQLQYKFIVSLEGNDVATNLKWIMSSNSLAVSPKLRYETWFMEGTLEPGKHYVGVEDDFSDFEEKINYYTAHPEQAERILRNAHEHLEPFRNKELEELICIRTLERYFELSGQIRL